MQVHAGLPQLQVAWSAAFSWLFMASMVLVVRRHKNPGTRG
jgi:hypothetical protein